MVVNAGLDGRRPAGDGPSRPRSWRMALLSITAGAGLARDVHRAGRSVTLLGLAASRGAVPGSTQVAFRLFAIQ